MPPLLVTPLLLVVRPGAPFVAFLPQGTKACRAQVPGNSIRHLAPMLRALRDLKAADRTREETGDGEGHGGTLQVVEHIEMNIYIYIYHER